LTFSRKGAIYYVEKGLMMGKGAVDLRFMVHEHHASHLHYDFRLEMGGIFKSWAIPKGPSMNPADKRLAIMVEDHPLEYGKFEGIIPAGHYGAGAVVVWDEGSYAPAEEGDPEKQLEKGRFSFELKGKKLKGGFSMAILKGRGKGNQWLLMKRKDERADPNFKLELALTEEKREKLEVKIPPCETDSGPP
jgi:bifunctional non-homologous end joining protein LigD